jgi:hypothetical protein
MVDPPGAQAPGRQPAAASAPRAANDAASRPLAAPVGPGSPPSAAPAPAADCARPPPREAPPPPPPPQEQRAHTHQATGGGGGFYQSGLPPEPLAPRALTPMGWLHRVVRQRWRGRFVIDVEDLLPDPASDDGGEEGGNGGAGEGGEGDGAAAGAPAGGGAAAPAAPHHSGFRLDGPQADEVGGEPRCGRGARRFPGSSRLTRNPWATSSQPPPPQQLLPWTPLPACPAPNHSFRAVLSGLECCVMLPDGRERPTACGVVFTGLGPRRRDAEQAAAGAARDWFVARGLWDPDTLEAPPPENIGLVGA